MFHPKYVTSTPVGTYARVYYKHILNIYIWTLALVPSRSRSCVTIDFFSGPDVFLFSFGRKCAVWLPINRWRRPIFATAVTEIGSWQQSGRRLYGYYFRAISSRTVFPQKRSTLFPKYIAYYRTYKMLQYPKLFKFRIENPLKFEFRVLRF